MALHLYLIDLLFRINKVHVFESIFCTVPVGPVVPVELTTQHLSEIIRLRPPPLQTPLLHPLAASTPLLHPLAASSD